MAHVWGYWDCKYCGVKHIRGDQKKCPGCGRSVDKDIKYYIDRSNITQVSKEDENDAADWICDFCDTQNKATDTVCKNCGSARADATHNYFYRASDEQKEKEAERAAKNATPSGTTTSTINRRMPSFAAMAAVLALFVGLMVLLFHKVDVSTAISGFEWNRVIHTQQYTECYEDDWDLPSTARLDHTNSEIHHYNQVLDHYETRSREVSHQECVGYDTEYRDLGNGQFESYEVPRYETVYETEYYDEPVYRDEPEYRTKYYYYIDRWVVDKDYETTANDHDPKWPDVDFPTSVSNPNYGDIRESAREEKYTLYYENGDSAVVDFETWEGYKLGDEIGYKTTWIEARKLKKKKK